MSVSAGNVSGAQRPRASGRVYALPCDTLSLSTRSVSREDYKAVLGRRPVGMVDSGNRRGTGRCHPEVYVPEPVRPVSFAYDSYLGDEVQDASTAKSKAAADATADDTDGKTSSDPGDNGNGSPCRLCMKGRLAEPWTLPQADFLKERQIVVSGWLSGGIYGNQYGNAQQRPDRLTQRRRRPHGRSTVALRSIGRPIRRAADGISAATSTTCSAPMAPTRRRLATVRGITVGTAPAITAPPFRNCTREIAYNDWESQGRTLLHADRL